MAVDPTYPLYPVLAIVSAFLLLLVLTTNFVRQSWNLGVTFLCFWVFWILLFEGVNSVIWADNADPKLFVYCDIVSHVYVIQLVATPASTLLITRRLYKIATMESLFPSGHGEILLDRAFEWTVGLGIPVLVAGVFYYIDQGARFVIEEGRGCLHAINLSGYSILTIWSWAIVLPTISLLFYIPKIFLVFYSHSRQMNVFLQTNNSISRQSYFRLLILGSLDILLTLPVGIIHLENEFKGLLPGFTLQFYDGWNAVHSNWGPASIPYAELVSVDGLIPAWFEIALAIVVFALFGLTDGARATYRQIFYAGCKPFGIKPPVRRHSDIETITFRPQQDRTSQQVESSQSAGSSIVRGETNVLDLEHGSTSAEDVSLGEKRSGEQSEKISEA